MHVTFRQLRLFSVLADQRSVSAAARTLHVTQPTASMQLRDLTRAVGLSLYEVIAKKVHLTDAGQELAQTARRILQEWEAFEQHADARRGLSRGQLRVAIVSTAKYFIPHLIGAFCRHHPNVEIALEVLNRDGVVNRLRDNRDDIYVMSMPPLGMHLDDRIFMENPLVLICAADDPLAHAPRVSLKQLAARRFILREKGSGTRMSVDRHFRRLRFRPDIRLELGSNEAIRDAVAGGLGIGIVSRHALRNSGRQQDVVVLEVSGFPIASHWHVVHPKAKTLSPLAGAFKQQLLALGEQRASPVDRSAATRTLRKSGR